MMSESWKRLLKEADVDLLDWPFRFLVASKSGPGHHLVDFEAAGGRGRCSCEHFQCVVEPARLAGEAAYDCKHVIAAKLFLADVVIGKLLQASPSLETPD